MKIKGLKTGIASAGIGHVVIPKELDPDEYIAHCYKTFTVSMHGGIGHGIFHDVSVDVDNMQKIKFPKSSEKAGSCIAWINIPKYNKPLIIGVLKYRDEAVTLEQNSKRITRESRGNAIDVFLRSNEATLDLNIVGNEETSGLLNINVRNPKKNSKLKIDVTGDVIVKSSNRTILISEDLIQLSVIDSKGKIKGLLKYKLGEGLTYGDEYENQILANKDNVKIKGKKKVNLGEGKEPIPLGNATKDFFNSIIDEVAKSTVSTLLGPMPLLNAAQITALKKNVDSILSKYSNTD